jgi:hypothetical protein
MRVLLLTLATCFVPSGTWVKTTGEEITVPCPTEYANPQRLPKGCSVVEPGVWYSVSSYRKIIVELDTLRIERLGLIKERDLAKAQLSKVRGDLLLCTAAPVCPRCPSTFINTTQGAIIGAVTSLGGCFLWNQYH